MALYVALLVAAFFAALLVYRYDLYEREPWYMILLAAGVGAVTMRFVGAVELFTLGFAETQGGMAALGALEEELARLAVVGAVAVIFPGQFDDPMDGIVYGSVVGLGMGLEESFYLLNLLSEPNILTLPVELVRLFGHLVMGGITGFGIGMVRGGIFGWQRALARTFAIAWALHFTWDWLALTASNASSMSALRTWAAVAIMLAGIIFYGLLVELGSRLSKERFDPKSDRTLWGWPFTAFFKKRD
jgi:RsiW-degrading membrane proteinase PrsW (M82 family)